MSAMQIPGVAYAAVPAVWSRPPQPTPRNASVSIPGNTTAVPTGAALAVTSRTRLPAPASPQSLSGGYAASVQVNFSLLAQTAAAIARLRSSVDSVPASNATEAALVGANAVRARDNATRIAETLQLLDRSIDNLSAVYDRDTRRLEFLSAAALSRRLLASAIADSVYERATAAAASSTALTAQADGSFRLDAATLERAFRDAPASMRASIADYARNLDGAFGAARDRALGLPPIGSHVRAYSLADAALLASPGDFATRRALEAFKATSLI